ncbi:MAG: hypothetical protein ACTSR8_09290 [Promethearchaeota archaeon]
MSEDTKIVTVKVKDLGIRSEQIIVDLVRFIAEQLPQADLKRIGNEIEITLPVKTSKRAIRLRIKKFLYKKNLDEEFRPISYKEAQKDGYMVKEKKTYQFTYY